MVENDFFITWHPCNDPRVSHAWRPATPAGSHACAIQSAKPRSSSLIEVFDRVLASTCLTITAQYSECEPSFDGSWPDTTTLYGGTEPQLPWPEIGRASCRERVCQYV